MDSLIPLALNLSPDLARWLSGDAAEATAATISQAVQDVTGTNDPVAASTALHNNPSVSARLRVELAKIVADRENAAQTASVSSSGSRTSAPTVQRSGLAWSAPVVSGIVLLTFATVMIFVLTHTLPAGSETMANMLLGTLSAMATSVVSYWVGSSAGSARKDEQIAQTVRAATSG
jgi:hypothetical protein